jgi:hypothetical protein
MTLCIDSDDLIDKWLAALRSGKYEQGTSFLRYQFEGGEKHCCLGVLCDIADGVEWKKRHSADHTHWVAEYNGTASASTLPLDMSNKTALHSTGVFKLCDVSEKWRKRINKLRGNSDDHCMLITLNDLGMPFHEIADLIDENREAFFG